MADVVWVDILPTSVARWCLVQSPPNGNVKSGTWKRNRKRPVLPLQKLEIPVRTLTSQQEKCWRMPALGRVIKFRDAHTARVMALVWMATNGETWCWEISCRFRPACALASNQQFLFIESLVYAWKIALT